MFKIFKSSICLCFLSAALLIFSYPKFDFWFFAWVAFVPMFFVLDRKQLKNAFKIGFLWGILFFSGTLYWFINMSSSAGIPAFLSLLAVVSIVCYLACYFGLFACAYVLVDRKSRPWKLFLLPSLWETCLLCTG